jgi:hypothetical protein
MNPYHHALSSVRKWGGKVDDYLPIHQFFDESKAHNADIRHRALRHHAEGIFLCERIFGPTITISTGRVIPTRYIGEQHVKEDLGWIPSLKDWFEHIEIQPWMLKVAVKPEDLDEQTGSRHRVHSIHRTLL